MLSYHYALYRTRTRTVYTSRSRDEGRHRSKLGGLFRAVEHPLLVWRSITKAHCVWPFAVCCVCAPLRYAGSYSPMCSFVVCLYSLYAVCTITKMVPYQVVCIDNQALVVLTTIPSANASSMTYELLLPGTRYVLSCSVCKLIYCCWLLTLYL